MSIVVKWLALQLHIQEVPGSGLALETSYSDLSIARIVP
jgi:hypothetical protein